MDAIDLIELSRKAGTTHLTAEQIVGEYAEEYLDGLSEDIGHEHADYERAGLVEDVRVSLGGNS